MNINWSRFDCAYVALYSGNKERAATIAAEMCRGGLHESIGALPFWGCRTAYDDIVRQHVWHNRSMGNPAYLNITLAHLRMVKVALELGKEHALFFEDDVRFLRDLDKVAEMIDLLPDDYDVAALDWVPRNKATDDEVAEMLGCPSRARTSGLVGWRRVKNFRSCAAYALSRRGMAHFVAALERPALGAAKLKICDQHWPEVLADGNLKGYVAVPNVCVQGVPGGATAYEGMWRNYARIGIRREDYAE